MRRLGAAPWLWGAALALGALASTACLRRPTPNPDELVVGITSDILFPPHLQRDTAARLQALACPATYAEIRSPWGHDAFLINLDQVGERIAAFLATFSF